MEWRKHDAAEKEAKARGGWGRLDLAEFKDIWHREESGPHRLDYMGTGHPVGDDDDDSDGDWETDDDDDDDDDDYESDSADSLLNSSSVTPTVDLLSEDAVE
ncbi:hypothetical protein INS49_002691 [Diaporthe citri]|uniref:uncharacterized protein n=1 Tax=Diaporthe citri TaxID=83186 RepID=UPI001C7E37E4|nr:uncharacterized protein INS49_002691 [Diaporthe citri]KAG6368482.1 hypothetical protein INS49_002691 [Diaporthe citri]